MVRIIKLSPFMLLVFVAAIVAADDGLSLRMIDEQGESVPGVSVSTFWGFNGPFPTRHADGTETEEQWSQRFRRIISKQMGMPAPEGTVAITDQDGRTSIDLSDRVVALAFDRQRTKGALLYPSGEAGADSVLGKLFDVKITLTPDSPPTESWHVRLNVPHDGDNPLANRLLGVCESFSRSLTLRLPEGDYEILAFGQTEYRSGIVDLRSMDARRLSITGDSPTIVSLDLELKNDPKNFQSLERESKAEGRWTRHESLVGEQAPRWNVTAARGIPVNSRPSDFRGKWLLLYFWSPDCAPCIGKSIPELIEFLDEHADRRHEFEVVTICYDFREEMTSMKDLDARLVDFKEKVWRRRELPFPVVLDSSFKSIERYGLSGVGTHVLVSPRGLVVKGGLEKLASVLNRDGDQGDE